MNTVVFCHGMPGSPADLNLLRQANPNTKFFALNLLEDAPSASGAELQNAFDDLLDRIDEKGVNLVGFSIGAMAAIRLATLRPDRVSQLTLISPAAPLALGEFLPDMAGKPVFDFAIKRPWLLKLVTFFQGLVVRISPNVLIKMLFSKCGPKEKELLNDPSFRNVMTEALSTSLIQRPASYLSYISAYVTDWSDILRKVNCPVVLWHGTQDSWSPPEMSKALESRFDKKATLNWVKDAEHYSTLTQVLL